MNFWKRVKYGLSSRERLTRCIVIFEYKTKADMTICRYTKEMEVDIHTALARGYVKTSDWDNWNICDKVERDIADKIDNEAEEMLKKVRKGDNVIHNEQGVWIEGKYIVSIDWNVAYPEFVPLTFEEYLEWEKKNGNKESD